MLKFKNNTNYYKKSLQIFIVLLLLYMVVRSLIDVNYLADFEAYCPFGGMMALSSFLVSDTLACSMTETQIMIGIMLAAGVLLFSKLFCSHICPLGTFIEWLSKIGNKFKLKINITNLPDRVLRIFKYLLLFVTLYFTIYSSELFCKGYDPYYAVFSGFDPDVNIYYSITAILLLVLGSIFFNQFWCKYLCPLSAATNIFTYTLILLPLIFMYLVLVFFGIEISWIWLILAICLVAFIIETATLKGFVFPGLKITRDDLNCTDCSECNIACPMNINISGSQKINHIDCHLCGNCLYACPENGTLKINKKDVKWAPASASVSLIALALYLATVVELPTINLKWASEDQLNRAGIYSQSGLKNIKCYGSSMSFATKMQMLPGIFGVETYVKSHTVKIFYDTTVFNAEAIKRELFSPVKTLINSPPAEIFEIGVVKLSIDKLFDAYDSFYLERLLSQNENIYGLTTEFGEPVQARLFYNHQQLTPEVIKDIIEKDILKYVIEGKSYSVPLKFRVTNIEAIDINISRDEFLQTFNTNKVK